MSGSVLAWFRDADGEWTAPDGRRGELVALLVALPVFAWLVHATSGLPRPGDHWAALAVGLVCGFGYAATARDAIAERLPSLSGWSVISAIAGSVGLSALERVAAADAVVAALLAAGATVAVVYLVRLVSPFHEGVRPPRRGVEPPSAVGVDE